MPGPFLQGFCQDGMVGISAGPGDDFHGFFKINAFFAQKTDQFRNYHGRMRVIDLDGGIIVKIMEITAPPGTFIQNQLCPGADHQILLVNPQETSVIITVVGIQK